MCLNEILMREQIVLMRYSQAAVGSEMASCRDQLAGLSVSIRAFPYPHRPFAVRGLSAGAC